MDKSFIGVFDDSMLQNMDEMIKRYYNTFLYVEGHKRVPDGYYYWKDTSYTPSGSNLLFTGDNQELTISEFTNVKISVKLPDVGYFNLEEGRDSLWFHRRPTRQFLRGICPGNVKINFPINGYGYPARTPSVSFVRQLTAALEKNFVSLEEAVNLVKKEKRSVAISSLFAVSKNMMENDDRPMLWFGWNPVGFISEKKIIVHEFYIQEVVDLVSMEDKKWQVMKM